MANIAGKLSFEEFAQLVRPEGGSGNTVSIEFLISGSMKQTRTGLKPAGDLYIEAISIPYLVNVGGTVQDNRFTFEKLKRLSLTGLESEKATVLNVTERVLKNDYACFKVEKYKIEGGLESCSIALGTSDPNNPHWFETGSIHSDYKALKDTGNQGVVEYVPNYTNRVYVDDYDVTIGMAQELRGSTGVWVVRTDVPDQGPISRMVTASIADSFFTDSGIALGHFCGTKHIGEYLSVDTPGYSSASLARRREELTEIGTQRDPAFMYLTGFSGSIIRDEYTDKDVEAGTINFEELKFSRYRVSGSKGDYYKYYYTASISDTGSKMEPIEAFFENIIFERWGGEPVSPEKRRPHQKHLQYFELFATGSSELTSSRSLTTVWPTPPPEGSGPVRYGGGLYNTGSLKLPELCDIIYQPTTGSVYSRVASSMFYVAESNAIYRTDRYGRVYQIDVLEPTGSVEPSGSDTPEEEEQ